MHLTLTTSPACNSATLDMTTNEGKVKVATALNGSEPTQELCKQGY